MTDAVQKSMISGNRKITAKAAIGPNPTTTVTLATQNT
jgi:hypothetical protein